MTLHKQILFQRRIIFDFYKKRLESVSFISFQPEQNESYSNRWLTTIFLGNRKNKAEDLRNALDANQIESRLLWKPMHLQPVFRECPAYTNGISEALFKNGLCLPSGTAMNEEDLERIVDIIKKVSDI